MSMLDAAITLCQQGYAAHWLRPRSMAPVATAWSTAPVATPDDLHTTYRPGHNVGVRCGQWSQPRSEYGLLVLDIDIRDPQYQDDATNTVEALLPEVLEVPVVLSGRGMGSKHLWVCCPLGMLPPKAAVTIAHGPEPAEKTWNIAYMSLKRQQAPMMLWRYPR